MDKTTKTYLYVGIGTVLFIIIALVIYAAFTGDFVTSGGIGAATAAAAAEAARRRQAAVKTMDQGHQDAQDAIDAIDKVVGDANKEMNDHLKDLGELDPGDLADKGNDLFN